MQASGGRYVGSSSTGKSNIRSSNNGRRDEGGTVMRKGPWMAEEDQILLEYVRNHGPRDWSSIRSKGLLPRTGKSCRLRWVNKLKPDLKTGCKFSPEEERIVIDLQAQLGNKWARIATYLPGRTDNDVKNFWSTRQKRLARILRTPLPTRANKNHGKAPISSHEVQTLKDPCLDLILFEGESSNGQCSKASCMDSHSHIATTMPDLSSPGLLNLETAFPLLEPAMVDRESSSSNTTSLAQLPFDHLSYPLLDLPVLSESPDLVPGFVDMSSIDDITCPEPLHQMQPSSMGLPFFGAEGTHHAGGAEHQGTDDIFFDDLPPDMFDSLELPPPPPSSSMPWQRGRN
ncbi:probable transcription factor MYB58 [Typha latifolia]|uniref:probable transcription factor MYB58 n=1 Tax=Typha latifolia TaxID=4733 RepID=UPI003C302CA2